MKDKKAEVVKVNGHTISIEGALLMGRDQFIESFSPNKYRFDAEETWDKLISPHSEEKPKKRTVSTKKKKPDSTGTDSESPKEE